MYAVKIPEMNFGIFLFKKKLFKEFTTIGENTRQELTYCTKNDTLYPTYNIAYGTGR